MADEKAVVAQPAAVETKPAVSQEDYEARIATLEAEKAKAIEEAANYKLGMLKAKGKLPTEELDNDEDKMRVIAREEAAKVTVSRIDAEKESLNAKLLKENKELKLALSGKGISPASIGAHSESQAVQDTTITTEQLAAFKARGWTDKDIERYKKNLRKNSR